MSTILGLYNSYLYANLNSYLFYDFLLIILMTILYEMLVVFGLDVAYFSSINSMLILAIKINLQILYEL
jgi:hypothetical protein